jgi:hypothetical protein
MDKKEFNKEIKMIKINSNKLWSSKYNNWNENSLGASTECRERRINAFEDRAIEILSEEQKEKNEEKLAEPHSVEILSNVPTYT